MHHEVRRVGLDNRGRVGLAHNVREIAPHQRARVRTEVRRAGVVLRATNHRHAPCLALVEPRQQWKNAVLLRRKQQFLVWFSVDVHYRRVSIPKKDRATSVARLSRALLCYALLCSAMLCWWWSSSSPHLYIRSRAFPYPSILLLLRATMIPSAYETRIIKDMCLEFTVHCTRSMLVTKCHTLCLALNGY